MVLQMYESTRCPVCCDDPYYRSISDSDSDEEDESIPRVSFHEALRLAKEDRRSNNVTARMFKTAKKHKKAMKAKRRELRQLRAKMAPHCETLDDRIEAYTIKATDAHKKRHKKTLDAMTQASKMIGKSRAQLYASNLRIASKYGFVRLPRCSVVRRHMA